MSGSPLAVVRLAVVVVLVAYLPTFSLGTGAYPLADIALSQPAVCSHRTPVKALSLLSVACTNITIYSTGSEHQAML